jgi:Protein of unknown function (DUF3761)
MKNSIRCTMLLAGLLTAHSLFAQVPAVAPAGTTGICKDGTYSQAPSKSGACSGHKGVQTWYAVVTPKTTTTAPTATKPATPAPAASAPPPLPPPASKPAAPVAAATPAASNSPASKTAAPGGGPGLVWVNTASKVYHCPGTAYYGKTKAGSYMTEAAAKASGARADAGKPCSTN